MEISHPQAKGRVGNWEVPKLSLRETESALPVVLSLLALTTLGHVLINSRQLLTDMCLSRLSTLFVGC